MYYNYYEAVFGLFALNVAGLVMQILVVLLVVKMLQNKIEHCLKGKDLYERALFWMLLCYVPVLAIIYLYICNNDTEEQKEEIKTKKKISSKL